MHQSVSTSEAIVTQQLEGTSQQSIDKRLTGPKGGMSGGARSQAPPLWGLFWLKSLCDIVLEVPGYVHTGLG